MSKEAKKSSNLIRVFVPNARALTPREIGDLPGQEKAAAAGKGLWLEVACPEGSCSVDGGTICLPASVAAKEKQKGIWFKIFCPEDRCYFDSASGLP
jgi:hypothetical protein